MCIYVIKCGEILSVSSPYERYARVHRGSLTQTYPRRQTHISAVHVHDSPHPLPPFNSRLIAGAPFHPVILTEPSPNTIVSPQPGVPESTVCHAVLVLSHLSEVLLLSEVSHSHWMTLPRTPWAISSLQPNPPRLIPTPNPRRSRIPTLSRRSQTPTHSWLFLVLVCT